MALSLRPVRSNSRYVTLDDEIRNDTKPYEVIDTLDKSLSRDG